MVVDRAAGTGMYRRSLGRPGWAIPNRSGDGVSDKSARVESPRATGLSSVAFASGVMETHLLTGERNISPLSHRILTLYISARIQRPHTQSTPPPNLTYHPIVIKLAFPPAAAVFTLSERSSSRRSSRIPVSPCENPCTDTIAPGRSAIFSHRLRSWSESPW